jgi:serine/threonine kinase 32
LTSTEWSGRVPLARFVIAHILLSSTFSVPCIQVRVVQHKKSKRLYALKYMHKQQCIKQKAVPNIIQERRLLEEVRHRFIYHVLFLTPSV